MENMNTDRRVNDDVWHFTSNKVHVGYCSDDIKLLLC